MSNDIIPAGPMTFKGAERRYKMVYVAQEYLLELLRTGTKLSFEILSGVPQDAVYVRDFYDNESGGTAFVFFHPDFEPVQVGCEIPRLDVVVTRIVEQELIAEG